MAFDHTPPFREWPSNTFGSDGQRLTVEQALNKLWEDHFHKVTDEEWAAAFAKPPEPKL